MEMMISISIFGIMTGLLMASFRTGRFADELRIGVQAAATSVREVQTLALSGSTVPICRGGSRELMLCPTGAAGCPGGTCTAEVPLGFGVRFGTTSGENRSAVVFADVNGNRALDSGEEIRSANFGPARQVIVSTLAPVDGSRLEVVFEPPRPTVYLNGGTATTSAVITLRHGITTQTKAVRLNRISGQVSAD